MNKIEINGEPYQIDGSFSEDYAIDVAIEQYIKDTEGKQNVTNITINSNILDEETVATHVANYLI
jgi:hypothetical protein